MTIRSTRLVACLVLLIVLASGASLASSGPAIAADGTRSTFCLTEHGLFSREARHSNYSNIRLAQHCRCCGKDENGHCNHQCCD